MIDRIVIYLLVLFLVQTRDFVEWFFQLCFRGSFSVLYVITGLVCSTAKLLFPNQGASSIDTILNYYLILYEWGR